ncbi:MAG: alpha/beta hydrolase [Treponema sp.]|nr:alpha/beta hydrolase [Treponema sp.]
MNKSIKKIACALSVLMALCAFTQGAFAQGNADAKRIYEKGSKIKIKIWNAVGNTAKPSEKVKGAGISYLVPYFAMQAKNGAPAVIVCPGGSYHHLGMGHEGHKVAKWFQSKGINAFVLRYRVSQEGFHHPAMLEDIQRSIQILRENASEWNINAGKIGAIGFSAGGHLVVMAGAFGDKVNELKKLGIDTKVSLKPNYVMPVYPVVSMQEDIGHAWSRKSLIGKNPTQAERDEFSMELQMKSDMCPVFLLTNRDDRTVMYENSVRLDAALTKAGVEHIFILNEKGDHGFGMGNGKFVKETHWNERWLLPWLKEVLRIDIP